MLNVASVLDPPLHTDTNDLPNKANTLQKIRKFILAIMIIEIDTKDEIELVISSVFYREDQDFEDQMKELDTKLQNFCESKVMGLINSDNIDGTCHKRSRLLLIKQKWNRSFR